MKGNLVLAGVSFPCGSKEIGSIACSHGLQPVYLEHFKFASSIEQLTQSVQFCEQIPNYLIQQDGFLLPILESWVSEGVKLTQRDALRFDTVAARVSRSKLGLSLVLEKAGLNCVPRRLVDDLPAAIQAANALKYPVVLRTDTGYSGRGVWVVQTPQELESKWALLNRISKRQDFREMNQVLGRDVFASVVEPYFESEEWSVDFIVSPELILLIRITEKAILLVDGRPLTVGYRLIDCSDIRIELSDVVAQWARALFEPGSTSFGCFDVRRNRNGKLIALDFGARLGGDQVPRLVRAASDGLNPYAAALDAVLSRQSSKIQCLREGAAMVHVFAKPNSVFRGLSLGAPHRLLDCRALGHLSDETGHNRVASVMSQFATTSEFFDACTNTDSWLQTIHR